MYRHHILFYPVIMWDNYTWIVYFMISVFMLGMMTSLCFQIYLLGMYTIFFANYCL